MKTFFVVASSFFLTCLFVFTTRLRILRKTTWNMQQSSIKLNDDDKVKFENEHLLHVCVLIVLYIACICFMDEKKIFSKALSLIFLRKKKDGEN